MPFVWSEKNNEERHYTNPQNRGVLKKHTHQQSSFDDDFYLRITLSVNNDIITRVKYDSNFYPSALAAFSYLSIYTQDFSVKDNLSIIVKNFLQTNCGFLKERQAYSDMWIRVVDQALKGSNPNMSNNERICRCFNVFKEQIAQVVYTEKSFNIDTITNKCKATWGCGGCFPDVEAYIKQLEKKTHFTEQDYYEKVDTIRSLFYLEVPRFLKSHDTSCQWVNFTNNTVFVNFTGTEQVTLFPSESLAHKLSQFLSQQVGASIHVKNSST